jgi:hypothetical protein
VDTKNATSTTKPIEGKTQMTDIRKTDSEDAHAVWITDGDEKFVVPKRYAHAIVQAVPMLRYSFEHLGGKFVGRAPKREEHEASE